MDQRPSSAVLVAIGRGAGGFVAVVAAFLYLAVGTGLVWTAFAIFNAAFGAGAGVAAAVFVAVPFGLLASVIRGWSPRSKSGQLWIAGAAIELVALALVLQFFTGWWGVAAVVAVGLPAEIARHAARLCNYEALDFRALLSRDAWLHPRRVRQQRLSASTDADST